ncbi:MAG: PEGA domain-containing protein [Acidobacteria bacterium]|nr:PEGA domain-containing protein [Acidobacteriota bacterium]
MMSILLVFGNNQSRGREAGRRLRAGTSVLPGALWVLQAFLILYGLWGLTLPKREVRVTSDPPGAVAIIDGWFIGETPFVRKLPLRSHRIVFRAIGFEEEAVAIPGGTDTIFVQAQLKPRRPPWNDACWKGGRIIAQ